ncbi:MAG: class I SAM-dependent methyltransferase [Bacteroidota bacterium]|nr:class I SAM-dependent methyltransferase [Kiloniellaceae bacterium]
MSNRSIQLDDALYDYRLQNSLRETDVMRRLREETAKLPGSGMQIGPEQGQFMALLVELMGARRCLEVGTFTGYSALAVAQALPEDGRLVACDVNEKTAAVARRYWQEAGVAGKIDLRLAPAVETLDTLLAEGAAGSFDFAFIDADKTSYDAYYERALRLLRKGGLVAVDNVLWGGAVTDSRVNDADTRAIRALNAKIAADQRVSCSLLPLGDGLTLARKREN